MQLQAQKAQKERFYNKNYKCIQGELENLFE